MGLGNSSLWLLAEWLLGLGEWLLLWPMYLVAGVDLHIGGGDGCCHRKDCYDE